MAAKVVFLCFLVTIFSNNVVNGQQTEPPSDPTSALTPTGQPSSIEPNTDIAYCTCDLTENGCDVECCCDVDDCSQDDIAAFSRCIDEYTPADSQTCVKSSIMFSNNVPIETNETVPGLFCVYKDNYEDRNFYEVPQMITTEDVFNSYVEKYGSFSYGKGYSSMDIPTEYYRSGDVLLTVYESLALGMLSLPKALTSVNCLDTNPAAFLYDEITECVRPVSDLAAECQTNPMLDGNTYFKYLKIISSPEALIDLPYNITVPSLGITRRTVTNGFTDGLDIEEGDNIYNSSISIEIRPQPPHTCIVNGLNVTCDFEYDIPSPTFDLATGVCNNAVIKVEYLLVQNGTYGITSAGIRFTFNDIDSSALPLVQSFFTKYSEYGKAEGEDRSGNPGYQVGQPILAGRLIQYEDPVRGTLQAIEMDSDPENRLTVVTSDATGTCLTDPNNRLAVTFGEEMRTGCNIKVSLENMTEICSLIQDAATLALLGNNPPKYVATFGNTDVEAVGDWVQILTENEPQGSSPSRSQAGVCLQVVLGMQLEIVYADVGALGNPQPKILGVNYRFDEPQDIYFQCIGPYCQPGTEATLEQAFEVVTSVSYIDASKPVTAVDGKRPSFTVRLPSDFFYPFA